MRLHPLRRRLVSCKTLSMPFNNIKLSHCAMLKSMLPGGISSAPHGTGYEI